MSGIISVVKGYHKKLFLELSDGKTDNWLLMYDPMPIFIILVLYHYFVTSLGPKLMKNRTAFQLKNTLLIYNIFQIVGSFYVVAAAIKEEIFTRYSWQCEPIDYSDNPRNIGIATFVHFYFLLKICELLETIFFVLRKKNNQITFLHLYHHTLMVVVSWLSAKYFPSGHEVFTGVANSFVHVIMYGYYLLSGLGPKYQKYLWWKKYLTTLQLVQFVVIFLHSLQLVFYDCVFPKWSLILTLPNSIIFYYLFNTFYDQSYKKTDQNENVLNGVSKSVKAH